MLNKNWIITIKSDVCQSFTDPMLKKKYIGTIYRYGKLFFSGNEEQLNEYELYLIQNRIKVIGSEEEGVKQLITRNQAMLIYRKAIAKQMSFIVDDEPFNKKYLQQQKVTSRIQKWYLSK